MRFLAARLVAVIALFAAPASASLPPTRYDLANPRRCLAGSWGHASHREWRVQFGVFDRDGGAARLERELQRRGVSTETFIAIWLVRGEREPLVLVSPPFPSRAAAERAARGYRMRGRDVLVRRFLVWER